MTISYSADDVVSFWENLPAYILPFLIVASLIGLALAVLWSVFIASPIVVGRCRYFMESRQSPSPFSTVFSVFQTPYLNVVKVSFLTGLKIFAGMFLLLIPGIYWSYCYALVPYLLAENPYLTTTRAMELSKEMMYGEKLHYFVLELSFIGWNLLCILTFGIGFFFLAPYQSATFAEFYAAMRAKALSMGMTTTQELGGFVRHDNPNY
ncbi:DUF975 family protein [Subdoligranulum variabile]|uniref:DUF975 family protein n=1 Tax=Subdoligranulum variabile TaxID=214851 RepID=UPI0026EFDD5A|nr:DUF975 family protein [Subdoligranulum variabile]